MVRNAARAQVGARGAGGKKAAIHANIEKRRNREIREIREPPSALEEGSGFFAYFAYFAVKKFLGRGFGKPAPCCNPTVLVNNRGMVARKELEMPSEIHP